MYGVQTSNDPSTFLTLPLEIRYLIYEMVFAGAKILLPVADARRRSERLKASLPAF